MSDPLNRNYPSSPSYVFQPQATETTGQANSEASKCITDLQAGLIRNNPAIKQVIDAEKSNKNYSACAKSRAEENNYDYKPKKLYTDPNLTGKYSKINRQKPYINISKCAPINLNGEVVKDGRIIYCRHLAAQFILSRFSQDGRKLHPRELFSSEASIEGNMDLDIDSKCDDLKKNALACRIITGDEFGKELTQWAVGISDNKKRSFLLSSCGHAMAFEVECKKRKKDDSSHYVVRYYDPNFTNVVSKCSATDPEIFNKKQYKLRDFINGEAYEQYVGISNGSSKQNEFVVYEHSDTSCSIAEKIDVVSSVKISPAIMRILLDDGRDAEAITAMKSSFAELEIEEKVRVLQAKNNEGTPGLFLALARGHANAVAAFGELLTKIPSDGRVERLKDLLGAKDKEGVSGLYMALTQGHAEAIKAFGELLLEIPSAEHVEWFKDLLGVKGEGGISGLYGALVKGHVDAIKAYGELLSQISSVGHIEWFKDLLSAEGDLGLPGLCMALFDSKTESIRAFGELLAKIPSIERAKWLENLLYSNDSDGIPYIFWALGECDNKAFEAFRGVLSNLDGKGRNELIRVLSGLDSVLNDILNDILNQCGKDSVPDGLILAKKRLAPLLQASKGQDFSDIINRNKLKRSSVFPVSSNKKRKYQ